MEIIIIEDGKEIYKSNEWTDDDKIDFWAKVCQIDVRVFNRQLPPNAQPSEPKSKGSRGSEGEVVNVGTLRKRTTENPDREDEVGDQQTECPTCDGEIYTDKSGCEIACPDCRGTKYYCHNGGCKFDCSVEITESTSEGKNIGPPLGCLLWEKGFPQTVSSPAWRDYPKE